MHKQFSGFFFFLFCFQVMHLAVLRRGKSHVSSVRMAKVCRWTTICIQRCLFGRLYILLGYIFCIIYCHICRDIFDKIDIMYCRLPYVSRSVLPLKTLVLYIYQARDTIQYNQQSYPIYSSYMASD
jgi:hypothetical protein